MTDIKINTSDAKLMLECVVGRVSYTLKQLEQMGLDSVISFDNHVLDPVELLYKGRLLARGTLVNVNGQLGFKIQESIIPKPEVDINPELVPQPLVEEIEDNEINDDNTGFEDILNNTTIIEELTNGTKN